MSERVLEVGEIGVFFRSHKLFPEFQDWKEKGETHLVPPHIYITMPFNYPDMVFVTPISALLSLWENREEFVDCDEATREEILEELSCLIETKELSF